MKRNESNADRIVRVVLAVAFAFGGYSTNGTLSTVLYVLAIVMAVTAATGFCLLYKLFGIDTCKMAKGCGDQGA
ncbi:MAG: DUF2892 domain-containing protein [Anaerosomatales bacterium]|nr:DUF2892 domain-containing protein [Anaerosomatales bacterium]